MMKEPEQREKLRNLFQKQLPTGTFPVKIEVPVFPTVTASLEFRVYDEKPVDPSHFVIPKEYTVCEDVITQRQLPYVPQLFDSGCFRHWHWHWHWHWH